MLQYKDLDTNKKLFVFELDNVIYPEKDYLLQVYYLFANFLEFTEGHPPAADLIRFFQKAYESHNAVGIFDRAAEVFGIDEKYRQNFEKLHSTAILPLKLLLFQGILELLQEITVDRKQIAILSKGAPEIQINKIRQTEWNGLEKYISVFYLSELKHIVESDVITYILDKYNVSKNETLMVGADFNDKDFAHASGIDYIDAREFHS